MTNLSFVSCHAQTTREQRNAICPRSTPTFGRLEKAREHREIADRLISENVPQPQVD